MRNKIFALVLPLAALAMPMPAQAKLTKDTSQVKGTILRQKEVSLATGDIRHKLVLVKATDGRQIPVDLGPTERLKDTPLNVGSSITATGKIHRVGDRPVLFAQTITVGNTSLKIQRTGMSMPSHGGGGMQGGMQGGAAGAGQASGSVSGGGEGTAGSVGAGAGGTQAQTGQTTQNVSGRIVHLKNVTVETPKSSEVSTDETTGTETTTSGQQMTSTSHKVALLRTNDGQQLVVDLGPANKLKRVKLKTGQRISVQARPVRIGDRLVLLADKVSAGGRTVKITQAKPMSAMREEQEETGTEPSTPSEGTTPEPVPGPGTEEVTPPSGGQGGGTEGGTQGGGTQGGGTQGGGTQGGGTQGGQGGGDTGSM